jgi:hypothetical protein
MRVISQSGTIDLPYENFVIGKTASNEIVAMKTVADSPGNVMASVIAKYSTEEKAIRAMKMLREEYQFGKKEYLEKGRKPIEIDSTSFSINSYCVPSKVFQFPADDEIEV